MYYRINEFLENWEAQGMKTKQICTMIPDESKMLIFCEEVRSMDRLAFHITQGMVQIGIKSGLLSLAELHEDAMPENMAGINAIYSDFHLRVASSILKQWNDEMLTAEIEMYGQQFRRGDVLSLLEQHEMHHRSQLTMLMRFAGLKVPRLYGPGS